MTFKEIVDIEPTEMLLKNMEKFPELANENLDDLPSCFFEEEMFSLDEWKTCFEQELYERFGWKIDLSSPK
jgi:hypothetical protein